MNVLTLDPQLLIPRYLVHSFVYYQLGESLIPDSDYDLLAKRIYSEWDNLTHINKDLIDKEGLLSGGSQIMYSQRIEHAAYQLLRNPNNQPPLTEQDPRIPVDTLTYNQYKTMTTPNKKPKINSRSKGQRGEREIVKILQEAANEVYGYYQLDPPFFERNQNQTANGGYDLIGLPYLAVEVKMQERFLLDKWWEQAEMQANQGEIPLLFYRKSHIKWRVRMMGTMQLTDLISTEPMLCDISLDDFLIWFKRKMYLTLKAEDKIPLAHYEG